MSLGDVIKGAAALGLAKIAWTRTEIANAIARLKTDTAGSAATGNFLTYGGGVAYTSGLGVVHR